MYNQQLQKQTSYACTIYTMLNILKYDFGIEVKVDLILTIVAYMDKIGALLPKGAYFAVIYPAMVKYIELKTGLKLRVKKSTISSGLDNKSTWGIGFKKATKLYIELAKDGRLTKSEIEKISKHKKSGGHNHAIKQGNKSYKRFILESLGGFPYHISLKNLQYMQKLNLYYDTARTLMPNDRRTIDAQKTLIQMVKDTGKLVTWEEFKKIDFK